jgi:hypothetical protein
MKTKLLPAFCLAALLIAEANASAIPPAEADAAHLEKLVSPIALYPDALVALILPASTRPSDIVLAARFLERGSRPAAAATEFWQDSVKALVHYPEVLAQLDEDLAWTQELGEFFLARPDAVMDAIQALRDRALKNGLLADTPEHAVIVEDGLIRIVPARATVIHVPRYDPEVLRVTRVRTYHPGPFISFGVGYGIGSWLSYDCDWRHRSVVIVHRPAGWYHRPDWRRHHHHHSGWTSSCWSAAPRHHRMIHHPAPPRAEPRRESGRGPDRPGWHRPEDRSPRRTEHTGSSPARRETAHASTGRSPETRDSVRSHRRENHQTQDGTYNRERSRPTQAAANHARPAPRHAESRPAERPARPEPRANPPPRSRDDLDTMQRELL